MNLFLRCALLACAMTPIAGFAQSIVTTWNLTVTNRYSYASGSDEPFAPFGGTVTITTPDRISSAIDYGSTTITEFGGVLATGFSSPVTSLVGSDPFGGGVTAPYNSYTFPNVSDYAADFIEEFAAQRNTYSLSPDSSQFWSYHIELRAITWSQSLGGTGAADYAFTTQQLIDYLYAFQSRGGEAYFNESFELYDLDSHASLDGFSWSGTATLASISVVPEPCATAGILGFGGLLCAAFAVVLKRKRPNQSPEPTTTLVTPRADARGAPSAAAAHL